MYSPPLLLLVSTGRGGQEGQEAAVPRKTVYSVALMSCWGPSHLAATPNLLPLIFPENPSDKPVQPPSALHVPHHLALSSGSQPCEGRGETEAKNPVKGSGWSQVRAKAVCGGPGS